MLIKYIILLTDNHVQCMKLLGAAKLRIQTETIHNITHTAVTFYFVPQLKNYKSTLQVSITVTVELLLTNCHRWIVR